MLATANRKSEQKKRGAKEQFSLATDSVPDVVVKGFALVGFMSMTVLVVKALRNMVQDKNYVRIDEEV
jgi:hypothetical protein